MVHKYKLNGANIVMDVNSGAVHLVDDMTYDILEMCGCKDELYKLGEVAADGSLPDALLSYDRTAVAEAVGELCELTKEGMLFSDDVFEGIVLKRGDAVKALCLHAAHECNLQCAYCFAGGGEYHSGRSLMSFEVGKDAIDFVIGKSGARKNIEIDFFGGEPTLNFDTVKKITEYAKEREAETGKNIRLTLTTNGLLLDDEMMKYINENMSNVVLSIDGRREVNDRMRYRYDGSGSYDTIVPKFQKLADSRGQMNYYVRGTFTRENLDFFEDVMHLASLGFKQISVEPVVASGKPYALDERDIPVIFEQYEKLAVELLNRSGKENDFNFFHFMIDLSGGPCAAKRISGCGAGTEYLAVTPEGDLYPCHQFVGIEKFRLGNVKEGITRPEITEEFKKSNVYTKPECKECFAKFYCSGGCFASSYFSGGGEISDINRQYELVCRMQKKRVECAVMIKAMQHGQ